MKKHKLVLLAVLIIPWLTVPLLGEKAFKKYLPAALFIVIFTEALDIFGENKKWWRFYKGIFRINSMNFFNFGPYFVTSLWMLKLTYGKFPLYLISNTILHLLFNAFGEKLLLRYKIASLVRLKKHQYLLMNLMRALLLYFFQYITGLSHVKKPHSSS